MRLSVSGEVCFSLVDTKDLKSSKGNLVPVQVRPRAL